MDTHNVVTILMETLLVLVSKAKGWTCAYYGSTWCENGNFRSGMSFAGGIDHRYPEQNCCVCGKTADGM